MRTVSYPARCKRKSRQEPLANGRSNAIAARVSIALLDVQVEPYSYIGGRPPGTDADFIKLLTTGIARTGMPPNPPMPPFRMTRADAEAVLAYLKTLK